MVNKRPRELTLIGTLAAGDHFVVDDASEPTSTEVKRVLTSGVPLSLLGAPTGDLSIGSNKLTNVTDPTAAQDAATKNYVDTTAAPLSHNHAGEDITSGTVADARLPTTMAGKTLTTATLTQPALTLTQSTTPTPTAEGVIEWDTDNNQIKIGDGAATRTFSDDANISITESQISDLGTSAALVSDNLSVFAATTSAQLAGVISDETGTGSAVFANSPTLVTPALGTPASGVATNLTGLPIATGLAIGTKANLESRLSDVSDLAEADGDTYTGTHDFGGATLEVPNSGTFTASAAGQFGIDTTITDHTGLAKYHDGTEELTVIALPTANLTTTNDHVVKYNATNNEFEMGVVAGGGGGALDDVKENGTIIANARAAINFVDDTIIGFTVTDDAGNDEADVTATVLDDSITYAKIQNVSATDRILGRDTAGAGDIEEITPAALRTMINVADGANNYVHPNHTGDVTSVGDGAQTIANDAVTFAKMQNITTDRLLGRDTAATGDPEEISLNSTLEFTGAAAIQRAALTGDVTAPAGSNTTAIAAGVIVNADVNASAAIAFSKLAALTSANILVGNASNVATSVAMSGDVTISNAGVTTVADDSHNHTNSTITLASTDLTDTANLARNTNNLSFFAATTSAQLAGVISDETGTGALVFGSSPTIVTPTIASFTNATHDHSNAAGGGQLTNTAISASAAIDFSKLASLTSANILVGNGSNVATSVAMSGDTTISNTGVVTLSATKDVVGTHHIFIPALSFYPATTNPCSDHTKSELATNDVDIFTLDFAGATTNEIAKVDWIPPENWDAGTVNMKYYWTAAAGAGTVEFETSAVAISNDDALDAAFGTAVPVTDTFIAADDLHITPQSGAITIGGTPANADWVQFKLVRDQATDTKAEDAKFIGAVLEYTIDAATSSG